MDVIGKYLWHESFWLPKDHNWKVLENEPGSTIYLPQREDMLWSVCGGLVLLLIRYFFEYFISTPLGYKLGVKEKKRPPFTPNPVLEEEYRKNGLVSNNNLEAVAKKADMSVREVERWLRDRQVISKPTDIQRFNECSWHCIFYSSSFTYGMVVLWNKPWLWDTNYCWKNWPTLDVSPDIYWYYMIELSFYWCLIYTTLTDHKRKDFYQMIIHHVVTILLIYFSWAINFVRIGTLVLIAHDIGDIPMAVAKMMKYCGRKTLTEAFLGLFIVVWILSRLAYYPFVFYIFVIIMSLIYLPVFGINPFFHFFLIYFSVYYHITPFPSYYFFNGLLIVLQILHIIWSYMIARIAAKKIFMGEATDVRSDSESEEE